MVDPNTPLPRRLAGAAIDFELRRTATVPKSITVVPGESVVTMHAALSLAELAPAKKPGRRRTSTRDSSAVVR